MFFESRNTVKNLALRALIVLAFVHAAADLSAAQTSGRIRGPVVDRTRRATRRAYGRRRSQRIAYARKYVDAYGNVIYLGPPDGPGIYDQGYGYGYDYGYGQVYDGRWDRGFDGPYPMAQPDYTIYEQEAKSIIARYFRRRRMRFRANPIIRVNGVRIRPDFRLRNHDVIIEYISPEDMQSPTNRESLLSQFQKGGGIVYFMGPKTTLDLVTIEQELDQILEEVAANNSLVELPAEKIIATYLDQAKIPYKRNPSITIDGKQARPDFLLEEQNIIIEYWSKHEKHKAAKEQKYKAYRQAGGAVHSIQPGNKEAILQELTKIVSGLVTDSAE